MTQVPPADRYVWRASAQTEADERSIDARARAGAGRRDDGWVRFAGLTLAMIGVIQIITGLSALARRETFLVPEDRLLLDLDYTDWGWLYLAIGLVAPAAAVGVSRRLLWARVAGICLAVLSAVSNLAFLPVRPFTAATVIVLDLLAIYGIAVHGDRTRTRFYADRA